MPKQAMKRDVDDQNEVRKPNEFDQVIQQIIESYPFLDDDLKSALVDRSQVNGGDPVNDALRSIRERMSD